MKPSDIRVNRDKIRCVNATINGYPTFYADSGNIRLIVRQPEPDDRGAIIQAEARITPETLNRYTQRFAKKIAAKTNSKTISNKRQNRAKTRRYMISDLPPFKQPPGMLNVIIELDKEVVGFARLDFKLCQDVHDLYGFTKKNKDEIVEDTSIMIIDEYQGHGLGSVFAELNEFIAKELGADWISGTTFVEDGMLNIRLHDGWSVVNMLQDYGQAIIRKRLS